MDLFDANTCDGCMYAIPIIGIALTGDAEPLMKCRRYPPQIYLDGDGDTCQGFPDADYRCGEYKNPSEAFGQLRQALDKLRGDREEERKKNRKLGDGHE